MASKFTPQIRGGILERISAGASIEDACREVGLSTRTFKKWKAKAKAGDVEYAEFFTAVEQARRDVQDRPDPMDEDELLRVVSKAARAGSVQAMKLRWEMLCAARNPEGEEDEPADPLDELEDELAAKRDAKAS